MKNHFLLTTRELVLDALLSALLFVSQAGLSWLPNVELVSLLLILYTLVFRKHVWLILYVFVVLEGLVYGFGPWWFSYLYVWPILPGAVFLIYKNKTPKPFGISLLSAIFGMLFGLFCSGFYLIAGGIGGALTWWTAGIPYDIVHGTSNFFLSLVLFQPLYRLLTTLKRDLLQR
ncbi:hypothetical protein [Lacrimispora saccharolytica]|uniref:Energy-coupling factor transport system substrate-specific component n=1 Tax=Lacrimispora saccharolytica (strain ATCC 35040 / DSM 2544 / NRCC 2533 / WM1) TaxID=610130 RepID=D9R9F4_LACSW|nr:hypothetical protein [Lacrimispora saccharolytica]ADL05905.1 conserved hypothetical protein [[Clostridium] saccharolyticum WM1]QRV19959.1 hypothetical protein I6K70_21605 [Lacrimispora saccharolytica]